MSNTEFRGSMCLSSTNKYKLSEDAVKINESDNYFNDYKPLLFWHASEPLKKNEEKYDTPYLGILFPEEWKTQPLKFNHTMWTSVNPYSGYATPSTQIYPISIVDGHNIITMWKLEYWTDIIQKLECSKFDTTRSVRKLKEKIEQEKKKFLLHNNNRHEAEFLDLSSFDKFFARYSTNMCTDWGKMDENGESFGIFYDDTDNNYECQSPYRLTFEHNAKKLYELVEQNGFFPNCMLRMVEFLCCYRCESVKLLKEYYEFFMTNIIEPNKEAILA
jgi:hypothetical protein